jgi:hypothetical protein
MNHATVQESLPASAPKPPHPMDERIFIMNLGTVQESLQASAPKPLHATDASPSFALGKENEVLPLVWSEQSTHASPTCGTDLQLPSTKDLSIPDTFREELLSEFIYSYLPGSSLVPHQPFQKDKCSGSMLVAAVPEMTTALETTVLAMSTAKIGRLNDDPVLVEASLKSYVEGLWELQKALWDPRIMSRDETLAACMALGMFEVMECPAETLSGWISHFDGCQRLRGPEAHSSALGHQVSLASRTTAASPFCLPAFQRHCRAQAALSSCHATYLGDSDWTDTEVPWKNPPRTPIGQLLHETAELSNLFVQAFEIKGLGSPSLLLAALKVVDRCWEIYVRLRRDVKGFEFEMDSLAGPLRRAMFSTEANPTDDAKLGKLFPVAFHFRNLMTAFIYMTYCANLILLWAVLMHIYQVLSTLRPHSGNVGSREGSPCPVCSGTDGSHDTCNCEDGAKTAFTLRFDVNGLPPIEPTINVLAATRNICQSVEYCMKEEMRSLGPTVTVIPLMVVIDVLPSFPQCSRELAWAKAAFKKVNEKGFRLMRYVDSANVTQKP